MAEEFVISAGTVIPLTGPPIENGAVVVIDGKIDAVLPASNVPSGLSGENYPGCFLFPGFVNAHTHLVYTDFLGLADDADFYTWIAGHMMPVGMKTLESDFRKSALRGVALSFQNGITTLGENHFTQHGRDAMLELCMKGVYFYEVFGLGTLDLASSVDRQRAEIESLLRENNAAVKLGISPHAPYTVTKSMAEMAVEMAQKHDLPISTHVAEPYDEIEFFKTGRGRFADIRHISRYPPPDKDTSPLKYFDSLGIITPSTLVVHGIHLDDSDLEIISNRKSTLVTCPTSNMKLGCGIPPAEKWFEMDIPVCIATDSLASGESFDLFEEMRRFLLVQRGTSHRNDLFTAERALRMVTVNPSKALGFENKAGAFWPGSSADMVLVERHPDRTSSFRDPVNALVWGTNACDILKVWSDGKEVYGRDD